ncbi:MAG: hypothetical protein ACRDSN_03845, partial [Pseudonocardiaceae bacterium]
YYAQQGEGPMIQLYYARTGRTRRSRRACSDDSCCVCHPERFTIPLVWQIGCPTTGLPPAQPWHPSRGKVR